MIIVIIIVIIVTRKTVIVVVKIIIIVIIITIVTNIYIEVFKTTNCYYNFTSLSFNRGFYVSKRFYKA